MIPVIRKAFFYLIKVAMEKQATNGGKLKTPAGRKFLLAILIWATATVMCLCPPLISAFVFKQNPLVVLSGSEWVTVIGMIGAFYFGANVAQKKLIQPAATNEETPTPTDAEPAKPAETEGK